MTGLLNVIPYVGPWIGGAVGDNPWKSAEIQQRRRAGVYPDFIVAHLMLLAVFICTQLIDNFLFQPLECNSTSIKSSPLKIFIVLLMAGHLGASSGCSSPSRPTL